MGQQFRSQSVVLPSGLTKCLLSQLKALRSAFDHELFNNSYVIMTISPFALHIPAFG